MNGLSIWSYKKANSVVVLAPMRLARGFLNFLADLVGVVHVVQGRCLFLGLRLGESRLGSHEDPWICRLHDKRLTKKRRPTKKKKKHCSPPPHPSSSST